MFFHFRSPVVSFLDFKGRAALRSTAKWNEMEMIGDMKLKDYFEKYGISPRAFAIKHSLPITTMYRYRNEKCLPQLEMALKIQNATNGIVSIADLRGSDKKDG